MRLREYRLQTYRESDALLLEDRLHTYLHSENILNGDSSQDQGDDKPVHDGRPASSKNLVKKVGPETLYGILKLNEFDIEEKRIKRLRLFSKKFPWFF